MLHINIGLGLDFESNKYFFSHFGENIIIKRNLISKTLKNNRGLWKTSKFDIREQRVIKFGGFTSLSFENFKKPIPTYGFFKILNKMKVYKLRNK